MGVRSTGRVARRIGVACGIVLIAMSTLVARGADSEATARKAIALLGKSSSPEAAKQLRDIVRYDDRVDIRVAAARALGTCAASNAAAQLAWSVGRGGPEPVRRELERALSARKDGLRGWERAAKSGGLDRLEEVRLVEALAAFRDGPSREILLARVLAEAPPVRAAALGALAARSNGRVFLEAVLEMVLERHDDADTFRASLEAARALPPDRIDALLDGLPAARRSRRDVRALRAFAAGRRETEKREAAEREATGKAKNRYAPPPRPEHERGRPRRVDLVLAIDCTVAESLYRDAYFAEARRLVREEVVEGADLRLAFVGYRDELKDRNQRETGWRVRAFPLSLDLERAMDDGRSLGPGGVGDRAASVFPALEAAVARMNWRPDAARKVVLFTADDVDQLGRSIALVKVHREADAVDLEIRVRSRGKRTSRLEKLAHAAGRELGTFRVVPARPRGR